LCYDSPPGIPAEKPDRRDGTGRQAGRSAVMAAVSPGSITVSWLAERDAESSDGLARAVQPGPGLRQAAAI
jgi:hypothetical protein